MDFKENYYFEKYEQLAVLADTQKCKTILSRNTDTNEIVVFKVMDKHGFDVYHRLKDLDNSNIVDVMDCFLHEDKCVAVEELKRSPQQKYCTQGFATEKYNCGQTQSYYNH